ncbi:uncharacterized protein J3D65DRAFT_622915 [Phyllosticta citribraziliensis]|uniref:Uncharacterized protein n=1 Tax=Phyllosticta citribraziliensis TaxID=989973 RepID=A0ABR1LVM5_9PEZI
MKMMMLRTRFRTIGFVDRNLHSLFRANHTYSIGPFPQHCFPRRKLSVRGFLDRECLYSVAQRPSPSLGSSPPFPSPPSSSNSSSLSFFSARSSPSNSSPFPPSPPAHTPSLSSQPGLVPNPPRQSSDSFPLPSSPPPPYAAQGYSLSCPPPPYISHRYPPLSSRRTALFRIAQVPASCMESAVRYGNFTTGKIGAVCRRAGAAMKRKKEKRTEKKQEKKARKKEKARCQCKCECRNRI